MSYCPFEKQFFFWKTPETRFVLTYTLKCTTSAISALRAEVAAALGLASVTTFPRHDEKTGNKNAYVPPASCEMGSPFHTDSALLHAINHLQTGQQGKRVQFYKGYIAECREAHSKMEYKEKKEGVQMDWEPHCQKPTNWQVWESHFWWSIWNLCLKH